MYKTRSYMAKSVASGLALVTILYGLISVSSIFVFGERLINGKANLMNNINLMFKEDHQDAIFIISSALRFLFSTILFLDGNSLHYTLLLACLK